MNKKRLLLLTFFLIVNLACTITLFETTPTPAPTATATLTFTPTEAVLLPPTEEPLPLETYTPLPTYTPYPTEPLPTLVPTQEPYTPPPAYAVTATLVKNANCRVGPSQNYETYTSFYAGDQLEVVGRNPDFDNTWWMVVIPGTRATCWISFVTAQVTGNFDDLPIIYPPY